MKIVVLDGRTLSGDEVSWEPLQRLGDVTVYPRTKPEEVLDRCAGAEIIVTNKVVFDRSTFRALPELKFIAVTATGYNVIDTEAAASQGILVANVPEYSTASVAQHVFAMLLSWIHRPFEHDQAVQAGAWTNSPDFSFWLRPLHELAGRQLGIVGWGRTGQATARLGNSFGMEILVASRTRRDVPDLTVSWHTLDELAAKADVISLHCPLTEQTTGMVNRAFLERMKPTAILINTARGGLVVEDDLAAALRNGEIAAALLDVIGEEPMPPGHPLLGVPGCRLTPHLAWATVEARQRLLQTTCDNIRDFVAGEPRNIVNG